MKYTDEAVKDIIRCKNLSYYAQNYNRHSLSSTVETLGNEQLAAMTILGSSAYVCIDSPRGSGKTAGCLVALYHYMTTNPHAECCYINQYQHITNGISNSFRNMDSDGIRPNWCPSQIVKYTKSSIEFSNGSRCFFTSSNSIMLKGRTINFIVMDDMDFWKPSDQSSFLENYGPVIFSTSSKVYITTTFSGANTPLKKFLNNNNRFLTVEV